MLPQSGRVEFLHSYGLKTGKHFAHFGLESGMVLRDLWECIRLLVVPQDGHASEEIEPSERNGKKQEAEGKLGHFALSSPAELRLD